MDGRLNEEAEGEGKKGVHEGESVRAGVDSTHKATNRAISKIEWTFYESQTSNANTCGAPGASGKHSLIPNEWI